jgi:hypothetical protein
MPKSKKTSSPKKSPTKKSKSVVMTKSDYIKEHKKLILLLSQGERFVKEAKIQKSEMKKYM